MADYKMATERYAYSIGIGKGSPVNNRMATKSVAEALGCRIRNNTYTNNLLVRLIDLWSCSCLGSTCNCNKNGGNCTCNSCNTHNSYTCSNNCGCNSCNTNNSYTCSNNCSCNSCNTNNSYKCSNNCSCNSCNTNNSYTCSSNCSCNSCNTNSSYVSCKGYGTIYCKCNTLTNKIVSCSCYSGNTTPTSRLCTCVKGIGYYCGSHYTDSCDNRSCISYRNTSCRSQNGYSMNIVSYVPGTSKVNTFYNGPWNNGVCTVRLMRRNWNTSAACGSNTCTSNGKCASVACSCNSCNSDTRCSNNTISCSSNCSSHKNSAACGSNTVYGSCKCYSNTPSKTIRCTCYSNTPSRTVSCKCYSNTPSRTLSCRCYSNTPSRTLSCRCYSNSPGKCTNNTVCSQKGYKEGTNT